MHLITTVKSMLVFNKQNDLKAHLKANISATIGFVPTMGALHQGHLSLMEESMRNNDLTIVSIFVNPTQFNNSEDLAKYPRSLEADIEKIKTVSDDIIIYAPSAQDIYNGAVVSQHFDFGGLERQLEGKFRPGHFDGVGTVVKLLLEIVGPTSAYFGEKDFQQLQIIKKMVAQFNLPVKIIGCPIYREANGLAMSSRNERLTAAERDNAAFIYQSLKFAADSFKDNHTALTISDEIEKKFEKHPEFKLEYFQIAAEDTLDPCFIKHKNVKYRAFIAVFVNKIRLIDTISLN